MNGSIYLIDTSVWIEVFPPRRRSVSATLVERVEGLMASNRAALTGVIRFELLDGTRGDVEFTRLEAALDGLPLIPTGEDSWNEAARLSLQLRGAGLTIPAPDLLIAAIALRSGVPVLHRDRHFDMIAAHTPLRVESHLS